MKIRDICAAALMTALLCLLGPVTIPIGPVPLSMAGFGICLAGGVLGPGRAFFAALAYILLGAAGLPVFSGWSGGVIQLAGPTGGFILGYLPCAALSGLGKGGRGRTVLWMAAGTLVMYALGTAWFVLQTHTRMLSALSVCVLPFLPGDALKIVMAARTADRVERALVGYGVNK